MRPGKRPRQAMVLFDVDDAFEEQILAPPSRQQRIGGGTHDNPIELDDSDDDGLAHEPQPGSSRRYAQEIPLEPEVPDTYQHGLHDDYFQDIDMFDDLDPDALTNDLTDDDDTVGVLPNSSKQIRGAISGDDIPNDPAQAGVLSTEVELRGVMSEDECLARILELFPGIARHHVIETHKQCDGNFQQILDTIMDQPNYPKERDYKGKGLANRESTAEVEQRFSRTTRLAARGNLRKAMLTILKNEFPRVPVHFIQRTQAEKRHLYPTYIALVHATFSDSPPWGKDTKWRTVTNGDFKAILDKHGGIAGPLEPELNSARKARAKLEDERRHKAEQLRIELVNSAQAKATGAISECCTCFDEVPLNRAIHCNGETPHFTCLECAHNYISSEVGQSRCRLTCPSGCDGGFSEAQLRLVPDQKLVDKLLKLQQDQEIRDAGVDDIVECPFCDYKQVCPAVEEDWEFRCQKPECRIISCRKCQRHSHTPITCEEYAHKHSKDAALEKRHTIEEAMTRALVRNCNACSKPFIKEIGCNKMSCSSCGNLQCYVCSESITNYEHFTPTGKCPLHDDVKKRHEQEVKQAELDARAIIEAENPLIDREGLQFQVPEPSKQDETSETRGRRQPNNVPAAPEALGVHGAARRGAAVLNPRAQRALQLLKYQRQLRRMLERRQRAELRYARPAENNHPGVLPAQGHAVGEHRQEPRSGDPQVAKHGRSGGLRGPYLPAHLQPPNPQLGQAQVIHPIPQLDGARDGDDMQAPPRPVPTIPHVAKANTQIPAQVGNRVDDIHHAMLDWPMFDWNGLVATDANHADPLGLLGFQGARWGEFFPPAEVFQPQHLNVPPELAMANHYPLNIGRPGDNDRQQPPYDINHSLDLVDYFRNNYGVMQNVPQQWPEPIDFGAH